MTNPIAVRLEGISKKYRLFRSKRERIFEALHPFRKTYHREFWALQDINLEIQSGSTVGILGLNGSGKSTLLQIISSVLRPTMGNAYVKGKVAALLELGAGLNPQLSGRENVIMSSAIMGFDRERTLSRMEEIERFADIGEFFDQPMKTYSSGMYMRVAFAASIFVDPDILIIDEALAVGDGKFAEKCFARIRKFRENGKTILLVTHDRSTIPRLCDTGVLLHRGKLVETGSAKRIVDLYTEIMAFGDLVGTRHDIAASAQADVDIASGTQAGPQDDSDTLPQLKDFLDGKGPRDLSQNPSYNKYEHRFGDGRASIDDFCLVQERTVNPVPVRNDRLLDIYVKVRFQEPLERPLVGLTITSSQGVVLFSTHSGWLGVKTKAASPGEVRVFKFSFVPKLNSGDWFVELAVAENPADMCDVRSKVIHLSMTSAVSFDGLALLDMSLAEIQSTHAEPVSAASTRSAPSPHS
jgi:ABC-type polysaccharide/polyol phosphate transport system ATPase subunit